MNFVDVKNDIAFRKIFGNEQKKVILISFLNAVLGLKGRDEVRDVALLNPFQLPRIAGEKSSIIDVKATDQKGATFIVEMQVAEPAGFDKRVLYYTSKDYAGQIKVGDEYPKLRPVYFIGVLDFTYFSGKNYLSTHLIVDNETGACELKDIQFRFLELPKFNKKSEDLENIVDKWAFFIKNADELEVMPENIEDEGLKAAYEAAAQHNWSKEDWDSYIYAGMREQDERGRLERGIEKGIEKGIEQGEIKKQDELIRAMHENGLLVEMIAKIVKMDESEVLRVIQGNPD